MKRLTFSVRFLLMLTLLIAPFLYSVPVSHAATSGISLTVLDDQGNSLLNETNVTENGAQTALNLLQQEASKQNFDVVTKDSSFGTYIESISNLSQSDNQHYWAFYLNGVQSFNYPNYQPKNGDQLIFQFIPNTDLLNDEASVGVNSNYGTRVKLDPGATVLSLLQKLEGTDQVTVDHNQIKSIAGVTADSVHSWQITLTRNGKNQIVTNLSTPVEGKDALIFNLVAQTVAQPTKVSNGQLSQAINEASAYVTKNGVDDWEAVALSKSGKTIPASYLKGVTSAVKAAKGQFHYVTDPEKYTLGILAAGGNPTNVGGYNLINLITNADLSKQGLNGVIFGLIATDSANFSISAKSKWTTQKMVSYLLNHQNSDGGWAWDGGKTSDLDTTGMTLAALSKHASDPKVKAAIQKAEGYLSSQFKNGKVDNSMTAAQIIIGLTANKVDPAGTEFTQKDGTTLLSYLLSFQKKDGGFDWQKNDESIFSTEQDFEALAADKLYLNNSGSLYSFTIKKATVTQPKKSTTQSSTNQTQNGTGHSTANQTQKSSGSTLPNTSTPFYNIIVLGLLTIIIGVYFNRKRVH